MILPVFLLVFLVAALLLMLGYWHFNDNFYLTSIGWTFLFILGVTLTSTGVDYQNGYTMINDTSNSTVTYTYVAYSNHTVGYWLAIASFVAFALGIWQTRGMDGRE